VHFLAVDPRLGSMADLQELVAKAHALGLRVGLDWVINHAGPVFEYADGKTQWTGDGKPGPVEWTRSLKPVEFDENDFTRERVITNWNDPVQATRGDFPPNYRHFATDRPATQEKLIHVAEYWLKATDIDFIRLDAVRHVAPGFLPLFSKALRNYAAKLGKQNFLILGENSTGVDAELKPFLDDGSLDTLYHYPAYRRENAALHGAAPTRALEDSHHEAQVALGDASGRLTRFIDLHDTYRFLLADTAGELLKTALAFVMTTAGIPLVYYGTEQAFRQLHGRLTPEGGDLPADPQNREDMFASGQYKSESSAGDKFDESSASFGFLRALADLRKAYPALTRGAQYPRWSDASGPGIYAFSRIHEGQEVLVVMNTSHEARSAEMFVDAGLTPAGTPLEDALNPGYRIAARAAGGGSKATVEVPAFGARVLVRPAPAQ
jgi:glycosidase